MSDMDSIGNEKTISRRRQGYGGQAGGTADQQSLPAGSLFGQYKIIKLLGRGGMGSVYEAEHTTLGKRYALKLLPADFIHSANALERFKREARVMANLNHRNIIAVDDFGETDGRYWLRMELADGLSIDDCRLPTEESETSKSKIKNKKSEMLVTLSDLAKAYDGKLPQDVLLPILGNILDGLAYAHERGAVHRDLKPSNILLTTNNTNLHEKGSSEFSVSSVVKNCTAKIADFGLVKLVGEEWIHSMVELSVQRSMPLRQGFGAQVSLGDEKTLGGTTASSSEGTSTKSLLGTYEYMSPEQKRGEEADARSDIYSVGLMIYKLLTGRELGMRTPSQIDSSLDKGWDAVVLQALEEKPADRFQSLEEMHAALPEIQTTEDTALERSGKIISGGNSDNRNGSHTEKKDVESALRAEESFDRAESEAINNFAKQNSDARNGSPREKNADEERWSGLSEHAEGAESFSHESSQKVTKKKSGWMWVVALVVVIVVAGFGVRWMNTALKPVARSQSAQPKTVAKQAPLKKEGIDWEAALGAKPLSMETPRESYPWMSPATGMEFVWIDALKIWVGKYEVTNGEYRKKEPGHDSKEYKGYSLNGDRQPVVYVNFDDAQAYAKWLTEQDQQSGKLPEGYEYRLPAGDEWMTFAQCGDGREYPWGNNWPPRSGQAGNYDDERVLDSYQVEGNYRDGHLVTCNVEQSWVNPWGLYGVGGNVRECTTERANGSFDAWRGATWGKTGQDNLRCSFRNDSKASDRNNYGGFRLVLSRQQGAQKVLDDEKDSLRPWVSQRKQIASSDTTRKQIDSCFYDPFSKSYSLEQHSPADRGTLIQFDREFKRGDVLEFDAELISADGNFLCRLWNGNQPMDNDCLKPAGFGYWNIRSCSAGSSIGIYHFKVLCGDSRIEYEITTPSGRQIKGVSPSHISYPVKLGVETRTGHNGTVKVAYNNFEKTSAERRRDSSKAIASIASPVLSLKEGLLAYYPLDTDARDYSGHGLHGEIRNAPDFVPAVVGNGLSFKGRPEVDWGDEGDHILLPALDFSGRKEFSIFLWVKEGKSILNGTSYIWYGNNDDGWLGIMHDVQKGIIFSAGSVGYENVLMTPFNENDRRRFVPYALVYSNGTLSAYRYGELVGHLDQKTVRISRANAAIGRHWWHNSERTASRLNAIVDEVRIYDRALSPDEIIILSDRNTYRE